jgi:hypothetical protein
MEKQRQDVDVDVVWPLIGLKLEFESVCAQILGCFDLPSLPEAFSQIQCTTLFDLGSQLSFERTGERAAFVAAHGSSGSVCGGCGSRGECSFRGGRDSRGGGRTSSREPHECTQCGYNNHYMDFCWDLHGKSFGFAN